MRSVSFLIALLAGALPAISTVVIQRRYPQDLDLLPIARARNADVPIVKRIRSFDFVPSLRLREDDSTELGTFDLGVNFTNTQLFSKSLPVGGLSLSASCVECSTTGTGVASTKGITTDDSLLENVIEATKELFDDPQEFLSKALDVSILVELENLSGHFEFDLNFGASGNITIPLFRPPTPLGGEIAGNEFGVIFSIDLVITTNAQIDLVTGFLIEFPTGAQFEINPISGDLVSMKIDGVSVSAIPFLSKSQGEADITVSLRIGLKAGLGINLLGNGFDIEAGVFVDVPTYHAELVIDPLATCPVFFTEGIFGDAAAFAQVGASIDFASFTAGPSTAVTFWSQDLPGGCIGSPTAAPATVTVSTLATPVTGDFFTGTEVEFSPTKVTVSVPTVSPFIGAQISSTGATTAYCAAATASRGVGGTGTSYCMPTQPIVFTGGGTHVGAPSRWIIAFLSLGFLVFA